MTVLTFPSNPIVGQVYNAPNGLRYVYDGIKWVVETITSTSEAVTNSTQDRVAPMFVGGENQGITFTYNETTNTMSAVVTSTIGNTLVNGNKQVVLGDTGIVTLPYSNYLEATDVNLKVGSQGAVTVRSNAASNLTTKEWQFGTNGKLTLPSNGEINANQITIKTVDGNITIQADTNVFVEVAGGTKRWSFANDGNITLPPDGDILNSTGSSVLGGGGGSSDRLVNGDYTLLLNSNSDLTVPGTIKSAGGTSYIDIYDSNVILQSSQGFTWQFDPSGIVRTSNTFTKTSISNITTTPEIVWTATEDYISGVKLQIQVEANEVGDSSGWHSQVCEAIIASRGYASTYGGPGGEPVMTVYGVTHTSTVPLVTFTVQRNPSTKKIEVVGTVTAATTAADLRIYSVETTSRD